MLIGIAQPGLPLRIYLYEDEAGFYIGENWRIWEAQDFNDADTLCREFLKDLEQVLSAP